MEIIIVGVAVIVVGCIMFLKKTEKEHKNKKIDFYEDQESRVLTGGFKKQKLLNKTEEIARKVIIEKIKNEERLYAQVSLGEIIKHENWQLYRDISSKRVDFLVTDDKNMPIKVIEIHGQGHYQGKSATKRDKIKKIAIEDAGIEYVAIAVGSNEKNIKEEVERKLEKVEKVP